MGNKTSLTLHEAVESYNLEVVNILLDNGGDINVENDIGDTLLHVAINNKNHQRQQLVTFLLERGANPQLRDRQGESPLIRAIRRNPQCVPLILRNASGKDTVNIPDGRGNYPLHYALENETVLKMLLDNGAIIDRKNNRGRTPLHWALLIINSTTFLPPHFKNVVYNATNQLLMHGADVNSKDYNGDTPLHMAPNVKCVRLLLDKGAQVNSRNSVGETPLHKLSMYDRDKAYEFLLHGADVNSKDNYGNSPLHSFCDDERVRQSELNGQDLFGRTILDYFENKGHKTYFDIANILLDWGASLTTKNNRGRTPSDIFPDLLDWAKPHNVRKACVKLSDIACEELDLKNYQISCLEEAARLKLVRFGKNSLYDIFGQYSDPIFLSNEPLQKAVDINNYQKEFPIYCYLLQSTYKLAKKRSCMLDDAVDTLQTQLPREITWYILTFVDDDSLRNLIKAKDAK